MCTGVMQRENTKKYLQVPHSYNLIRHTLLLWVHIVGGKGGQVCLFFSPVYLPSKKNPGIDSINYSGPMIAYQP